MGGSDTKSRGCAGFWLLVADGHPKKAFVIGPGTLPVFSFEEEAEMFLRLGGIGDGWRRERRGAEEVAAMLGDESVGMERVALDPLPEMLADGILGLVTMDGRRFAGRFLGEPVR